MSNHPYDSEEFAELLRKWGVGDLTRGEFEISLEMIVDKHRRTDTREIAKLRELVKATCHTPLFIAGRFVPIDTEQYTPVMRLQIATHDELIHTIELQLRWILMANTYLRTQINRGGRDVSNDPIVAATCAYCGGPPHMRKLGEPSGCPKVPPIEDLARRMFEVYDRPTKPNGDWEHSVEYRTLEAELRARVGAPPREP